MACELVIESVDSCVNQEQSHSIGKTMQGHKKQERHGIKILSKSFSFPQVLVAASCWPSVLWSLNLNSNKVVYCLYIFSVCEKMVDEVKACFPSVTLVSREQALVKMRSKLCFVIGQGEVDLLWDLWNVVIPHAGLHNSILVCPYSRLKHQQFAKAKVKWTRFRHSKLGGLTNRMFLIGIPANKWTTQLLASITNLNLTRTLLDVVDQGGVGKPIEAPSNNQHLSIWNPDKNSQLSLPSFRSGKGWVLRYLSYKEMALATDLNELVISKTDNDKFIEMQERVTTGKMIPGKICQVATQWMLELWSQDIDFFNASADIDSAEENSLLVERPTTAEDRSYLEFEQAYLVSYGQKASKNDDDEVPVELWDRAVFRHTFTWLRYSPKVKHSLKILRDKIGFRWYVISLRRSLFKYLRSVYGRNWWKDLDRESRCGRKRKRREDVETELYKDVKVARDAITRAVNSSWWEWRCGSTCFFWRWPAEIRKHIRDGYPVHVEDTLPTYRQRQVFHLKDEEFKQLSKKVKKVVDRGYLEQGYVHSLINYFAVPKGEGDIRVVYDGTKCKLNSVVWSPNFFLPSIDSLAMFTSKDTWFADLDLGEMFLNYFIDERLRPYCGVDVSKLFDDTQYKWLRWNRTLMGFRSSPYIAVKMFGWTLEMIRGDRHDVKNPFRWNRVQINLPGSVGYNPSKAWICKMWNHQECNDAKVYVDDIRVHGGTELGTRRATRRASSVTQYLGEQNADRKNRPPSTQPGPWCGSFFVVSDGSVYVYVSQDKWEKAKNYVSRWIEQVRLNREEIKPFLDFKNLEKGRGFLVYLSRTYPSITPFLKGIHLTLDSWREGRDVEGWKSKKRKTSDYCDSIEEDEFFHEKYLSHESETNRNDNKPPKLVIPVPRLIDDLSVLESFFAPPIPPKRFVRGNKISMVKYGFGDASKSGFGSTIEVENGISFRYGLWGSDTQEESSNYRELENLAETLEAEAEENKLQGFEIFLLTDNSTAELAFFKGTSSSQKLFNIIVRLRRLEFHHKCKIHFVHVAGSRMIAQGTDGLSRGDLGEGVMRGSAMLSFVPLHKSASDRSEALVDWITSWMTPALHKNESIEFLSVEDWFWRAHDISGGHINPDGIWTPNYKSGVFVWLPAPAGGQVAVEQLRETRNKRTKSLHVFVIPRLFACLWRRQLTRVSDLMLELPFIDDVWTKEEQHEPLTLAFIFPFLEHSPWQLRRAPAFLELARRLPGMWKTTEIPTGTILCKLLLYARNLGTLPSELVCRMLRSARSCSILHSETAK